MAKANPEAIAEEATEPEPETEEPAETPEEGSAEETTEESEPVPETPGPVEQERSEVGSLNVPGDPTDLAIVESAKFILSDPGSTVSIGGGCGQQHPVDDHGLVECDVCAPLAANYGLKAISADEAEEVRNPSVPDEEV